MSGIIGSISLAWASSSLSSCLFDISLGVYLMFQINFSWGVYLISPPLEHTHTLLISVDTSSVLLGVQIKICKVTHDSYLSHSIASLLDNLKTYSELGPLGELANYGVGKGNVWRWPWNILLCQKKLGAPTGQLFEVNSTGQIQDSIRSKINNDKLIIPIK